MRYVPRFRSPCYFWASHRARTAAQDAYHESINENYAGELADLEDEFERATRLRNSETSCAKDEEVAARMQRELDAEEGAIRTVARQSKGGDRMSFLKGMVRRMSSARHGSRSKK